MNNRRPNGSAQITWGGVLMAVSLFLFFRSSSIDVTDYSGRIDEAAIAERSLFGIASGGAFSLAIILMGVGWIVRAIYFLPGREISEDGMGEEQEVATSSKAEATTKLLLIAIAVVVVVTVTAMMAK